MNRPTIDVVIPAQRETEGLERTIRSLEGTATNYNLVTVIDPTINVSEARQKAFDSLTASQYVCYLDDDIELIQHGWLDQLYSMIQGDMVAATFGGEWWGTEPYQRGAVQSGEVYAGPAACMLIDRKRIPPDVVWDQHIGLRSGWLGGDFEEVDFCAALNRYHFRLLQTSNVVFHHMGNKTTLRDFMDTDRYIATRVMGDLIRRKHMKGGGDPDFFKSLQYVKASETDEHMLAPGANLRTCYKDVIRQAGLSGNERFQKWGLV